MKGNGSDQCSQLGQSTSAFVEKEEWDERRGGEKEQENSNKFLLHVPRRLSRHARVQPPHVDNPSKIQLTVQKYGKLTLFIRTVVSSESIFEVLSVLALCSLSP